MAGTIERAGARIPAYQATHMSAGAGEGFEARRRVTHEAHQQISSKSADASHWQRIGAHDRDPLAVAHQRWLGGMPRSKALLVQANSEPGGRGGRGEATR